MDEAALVRSPEFVASSKSRLRFDCLGGTHGTQSPEEHLERRGHLHETGSYPQLGAVMSSALSSRKHLAAASSSFQRSIRKSLMSSWGRKLLCRKGPPNVLAATHKVAFCELLLHVLIEDSQNGGTGLAHGRDKKLEPVSVSLHSLPLLFPSVSSFRGLHQPQITPHIPLRTVSFKTKKSRHGCEYG